jgi:hypothetical protein
MSEQVGAALVSSVATQRALSIKVRIATQTCERFGALGPPSALLSFL